ncbi:ATP-grasp domain-containing protein [Mycolicibacterium phlei]
MKLARPDLFHPRIVFAGCPALPEGDGDDDGLLAALRHRGLHARWLSWDDPQTLTADLVILRATWDYIDRLDEFLGWAGRVRNLLNPVQVVRWNTDKHYLADLAAAGVPTVPSRFFAPGEKVRLPEHGDVVVKPAVGAGSVDTLRFSDRDAALRHAARLQGAGRTALVQPYDERIADGETALVFLGGAQSHAFTKGPILRRPDEPPVFDESGTFAEENLAPADPDFELWDLGYATLAAAAAHLGMAPEEFLYARVDVIGGRTDPRVLELELVEPSLGWRQLDAATRERQQRAFALGVESALDRLGLGPLSHRRP